MQSNVYTAGVRYLPMWLLSDATGRCLQATDPNGSTASGDIDADILAGLFNVITCPGATSTENGNMPIVNIVRMNAGNAGIVPKNTDLLILDTRTLVGGPFACTLEKPTAGKEMKVRLIQFPDNNVATINPAAGSTIDDGHLASFGYQSATTYDGLITLVYNAVDSTWHTPDSSVDYTL